MELLRSEVETFRASDGYELHFRTWRAQTPKADVVALHGIQSHSGWYEFSSRLLAQAGFSVFFLDRRGSGLNQQQRGHAPGAERLVRDVLEFSAFVKDRQREQRPLVLLAVSWGGKLATVAAEREPRLFPLLVLLYPGLKARVDLPWREKLRIAWLAVCGRLNQLVPVPLDDPALFTAEKQWQEFIRQDPLALRSVTVGFLLAHKRLSRQAVRAVKRLKQPVLVALAGKDRIVDNQAVRRLFAALPRHQCTLWEFPNAQHTLEFEPNRREIFERLLQWLEQRTAELESR